MKTVLVVEDEAPIAAAVAARLRSEGFRPLSSIKVKLGVVILAAVAVTVVVEYAGLLLGVNPWLSTVGAGALALAMVQFLAQGMTSPLREMAAAARAMARGDYRRRVTASSHDEVGELARAFNAMAAPASASPSPAGSSTCTAAASAPSATSRTGAAWSWCSQEAANEPDRRPL